MSHRVASEFWGPRERAKTGDAMLERERIFRVAFPSGATALVSRALDAEDAEQIARLDARGPLGRGTVKVERSWGEWSDSPGYRKSEAVTWETR